MLNFSGMYHLTKYVLYETIVIIIGLLFIFTDIMYTLLGRPETALMIISGKKKKKVLVSIRSSLVFNQ